MTTTRIHAHLWNRPGDAGASLTIETIREPDTGIRPRFACHRVTRRLTDPPARDRGRSPGDPHGEHTPEENPMRLDLRFSMEFAKPEWLVTALLAIREAIDRLLDEDDSTPPDDEDEE